MRKALATHIIYSHISANSENEYYTLRDITVTDCKGEQHNLLHYAIGDPEPYHYRYLSSMIDAVVKILKSNHFRFDTYHEFGVDWPPFYFMVTDNFCNPRWEHYSLFQ